MIFKYGKRFRFPPLFNKYYAGTNNYEQSKFYDTAEK